MRHTPRSLRWLLLAPALLLISGCPDSRPRTRSGDSGPLPTSDAGPRDGGPADPPLVDSGPPEPGTEGELRIAGGGSAGRLEVFHDGQWGTICDDAFDEADATVACRELGYTSGLVVTAEAGVDPIWMDDLECVGTEARLVDCPFPGFAVHNCSHSEDVGVECITE